MKPNLNRACLALLFAVAATAYSCKKSDKASPAENLLTSAPWKATTVEWRATVGGAWVDKTPKGPITIATVLTFFDNGTYSLSAPPFFGSGTWQLSSDRSRLTMVNSGGTISNITVSALTSTTLQFSEPLVDTYTTQTVGTTTTRTYYDMERNTYVH